ncbi:MAG TPA: hypothetical protein VHG53_02995 [Candidatus Limnocylindria bacterium]|nr:hypothetical protein [Candidatus Limnocylindria bacterium]
MTTVFNIIEHLCANPDHRPPEDVEHPFVLHAGKLAYCPSAAADDHDWRATGGKTLTTVREWLGRPVAADAVHDEAERAKVAVRR